MTDSRVYLATVVGEGPANGTTHRVLLGTRQTTSPDRALRWLCGQARRIADGLDPDPCAAWIPRSALVPVADPGPDVAAELRFWCGDLAEQEAARKRLAVGEEFRLSVQDANGRYTLSARPLPEYVPAPPTPLPGRKRHRKPWKGTWFDVFRRPSRLPATAAVLSTPRIP
nr:hypothetical protein OH820_18820 [Streptomyces sp. NBC_00857]